jgi:hypothetical protein
MKQRVDDNREWDENGRRIALRALSVIAFSSVRVSDL